MGLLFELLRQASVRSRGGESPQDHPIGVDLGETVFYLAELYLRSVVVVLRISRFGSESSAGLTRNSVEESKEGQHGVETP